MFRGEQFLTVAKELAKGTDQGAWRSAISRAYYAAFWVAREIIESEGVAAPQTGTDRSHDNMWDMLVGDYSANGKSLGDAGRFLKNSRTAADYRARSVSANDAEKAIIPAGQFIADLRALTASPTDAGSQP